MERSERGAGGSPCLLAPGPVLACSPRALDKLGVLHLFPAGPGPAQTPPAPATASDPTPGSPGRLLSPAALQLAWIECQGICVWPEGVGLREGAGWGGEGDLENGAHLALLSARPSPYKMPSPVTQPSATLTRPGTAFSKGRAGLGFPMKSFWGWWEETEAP